MSSLITRTIAQVQMKTVTAQRTTWVKDNLNKSLCHHASTHHKHALLLLLLLLLW